MLIILITTQQSVMNTNIIISIVVIAVIIVGGLFFISGDRSETLAQCEVDIEEAQAAAEGQICTQQAAEMQCGSDESVTYLARNGCEISFLANKGWVEISEPVDETAEEEMSEEIADQSVETVSENIITYTSSGFLPSTITVSVGETVTWVNESGSDMWVASAFHPTHTVYPNSDIKKCGTAEAAGIFDACEGVASGESWSFTFNSAGEWNYHDHLNVSKFGKVVVQ
jgi:plastocyanin